MMSVIYHHRGIVEMVKNLSMVQTKSKGIELAATLLGMSEVDIVAETALVETLETLAWRLDLTDSQTVVNRLRHGDQGVWHNFHYYLSEQLAEYLGVLDKDIKAAYIDEYDINPEDLDFGEAARTTVIYLILWVERKTSALKSLVAALDRALVQSFLELIGKPYLKHLLEVSLIDDDEAKKPVGYGALLTTTCFPLTELWRREGVDLESILSHNGRTYNGC